MSVRTTLTIVEAILFAPIPKEALSAHAMSAILKMDQYMVLNVLRFLETFT